MSRWCVSCGQKGLSVLNEQKLIRSNLTCDQRQMARIIVRLGETDMPYSMIAKITKRHKRSVIRTIKAFGFEAKREQGWGKFRKRIAAEENLKRNIAESTLNEINQERMMWSRYDTCVSRFAMSDIRRKRANALSVLRFRNRFKSDVGFRAKFYARKRAKDAVKRHIQSKQWKWNTHPVSQLIGCTSAFLKSYLEQRFVAGMTWDNMGKDWHIDHIKPLASANGNIAKIKKLSHYTNLQPMFAAENLSKGAKTMKQQCLSI